MLDRNFSEIKYLIMITFRLTTILTFLTVPRPLLNCTAFSFYLIVRSILGQHIMHEILKLHPVNHINSTIYGVVYYSVWLYLITETIGLHHP